MARNSTIAHPGRTSDYYFDSRTDADLLRDLACEFFAALGMGQHKPWLVIASHQEQLIDDAAYKFWTR